MKQKHKNLLVYLGLGGVGIAATFFILKKRNSMGRLGTDQIIGTGGIDNTPTDDLSQSSKLLEARIHPHDSFVDPALKHVPSFLDRKSISTYKDIDSSWIVDL